MLATLGRLMLVNYCILNFSHFYFVFCVKPNCVGDKALDPHDFSHGDDVGYVRDLCVDMIARHFINRLQRANSQWNSAQWKSACEQLAKIRTSGCIKKIFCGDCTKWKRSDKKNVTNQVMTTAVKMLKVFNKDASLTLLLRSKDDEKIIYETIDKVIDLLLSSQAAAQDSEIIEELEGLKKRFCTYYQFDQYQRKYLTSIERTDAESMETVDDLLRNKDLLTGIKKFIMTFEDEYEANVSYYYVKNNVKAHDTMLVETAYMTFEYTGYDVVAPISVLLKTAYDAKPRQKDMLLREIFVYSKVLPELYKLGACDPFAPHVYVEIPESSPLIVLQDLSARKFIPGNELEQFDLHHCNSALKLLATYHAAGYDYVQKNRKDTDRTLIAPFQSVLLDNKDPNAFPRFCNMIKPSSESLYNKLMAVEEPILRDPMIYARENAEDVVVIIHGDFRTNNIFFQHDDAGAVLETKLMNYQFSRKSNPAVDLIYFFVTSVPFEMFKANYDALLNSYLDTLNEKASFSQYNTEYKRPKLEEDLEFFKHYYLYILCVKLPLIMGAGQPGAETDAFLSRSLEWLTYLVEKEII